MNKNRKEIYMFVALQPGTFRDRDHPKLILRKRRCGVHNVWESRFYGANRIRVWLNGFSSPPLYRPYKTFNKYTMFVPFLFFSLPL